MKLIIISGRSGSGKSTVLNVLEDVGYYCIDNLPIGLLFPLTEEALLHNPQKLGKIAVSIDARNLSNDLSNFGKIYGELSGKSVDIEIIYLDALNQTLFKRFHATRRKHPLSSNKISLKEAIEEERKLLEPIATLADLVVDTSDLSMYELRDMIKERVAGHKSQEIALLFQSFGFKHGVPIDADVVFDVRCLPNPYWDFSLRKYTGLEQPVIDFLDEQAEPKEMIQDISDYLKKWLPRFKASNRSYMTIAIGCTGGQHRSVYVSEKLRNLFTEEYSNTQVRHKELSRQNN